MILNNLCLSPRPNQLLRWQQAFPDGKIVSSVDQARQLVTTATMLWLHADSLPGALLQATLAELRSKFATQAVIILTCMPNHAEAANVFKGGASGYCHAMAAPALLQQVALVVQNGGLWVGPDLMKVLVDVLGPVLAAQSSEIPNAVLLKLTPREQEVALQVGRGASNKEISSTLAITERTVKAHLGTIFEKLGIRDRLQLALLVSRDDSENSLQASL